MTEQNNAQGTGRSSVFSRNADCVQVMELLIAEIDLFKCRLESGVQLCKKKYQRGKSQQTADGVNCPSLLLPCSLAEKEYSIAIVYTNNLRGILESCRRYIERAHDYEDRHLAMAVGKDKSTMQRMGLSLDLPDLNIPKYRDQAICQRHGTRRIEFYFRREGASYEDVLDEMEYELMKVTDRIKNAKKGNCRTKYDRGEMWQRIDGKLQPDPLCELYSADRAYDKVLQNLEDASKYIRLATARLEEGHHWETKREEALDRLETPKEKWYMGEYPYPSRESESTSANYGVSRW